MQCLHQETARCLSDEAAIIGLHRAGRVWEREVLLRCDNKPAVFGHTVVPMQATATDWPLFSALGERSLGTTLFGDRMVRRGTLEFARLRAGHPLVQRAQAALAREGQRVDEKALFFARRCLYQRHQGLLLVTEVFLPAVLELTSRHSHRCNRHINKQSITMNLFFEESGDFKVGTVLSQAGEAYQVEMASGKRTKVKTKDVLLQYEKPAPAELLEQAKSIAAEIDLDFLWEVAGEDEFGFAELGAEYFGHAPLPPEAAGLILALHSAPVYFYKKGRGRYKAAPEASLKAALAGIEKKKQQALVQAAYVEELKQNRLPASMQPMVLQLLFKPDKNTIEYKALEAACTELHTTPPRLMLAVGGIASPKDLHLSKFLFENFPKGAGFPSVPVPSVTAKLPLADVAAFSIDDVTTTEIDDAFSVQPLPDGT